MDLDHMETGGVVVFGVELDVEGGRSPTSELVSPACHSILLASHPPRTRAMPEAPSRTPTARQQQTGKVAATFTLNW